MRSFALVPAAGSSLRMGRPKLLLPWRGRTVIEHVLGAWRSSRVDRTYVVVRADDSSLVDVCRRSGANLILPDEPPPEMKSSVQCALRYITEHESPTGDDVWLLAPADLPGLNTAIIDRLLDEHDTDRSAILLPLVGGRRAHPVLFPWGLAEEAMRLGEHEGVNAIVARHRVREIPVDGEGLTEDLDTPADYERWRSREIEADADGPLPPGE